MPAMWFVCPYKRRPHPTDVIRYCAMDDYTTQIAEDGGTWEEVEVEGDRALVKVSASKEVLALLPFPNLGHDALHKVDAAAAATVGAQSGARLGDALDALTARGFRLATYDSKTDTLSADGELRPCPKGWREVEERVK